MSTESEQALVAQVNQAIQDRTAIKNHRWQQ